MSYGPLAGSVKRLLRLGELKNTYGFSCDCAACHVDLRPGAKSVVSPYCAPCVKPECRGPLVGNLDWTCAWCGAAVSDAEQGVILQELNASKELFAKGAALVQAGQFERARRLMQECLRRREVACYRLTVPMGEAHDFLAHIFASMGDYEQATVHSAASLEVVAATCGERSIEYGRECGKLASILFHLGARGPEGKARMRRCAELATFAAKWLRLQDGPTPESEEMDRIARQCRV